MNYRMKVQYEGTRYQGWQRQSGSSATILTVLLAGCVKSAVKPLPCPLHVQDTDIFRQIFIQHRSEFIRGNGKRLGKMIEETEHEVLLTFEGSGFLYNMVRILTGTLVEVGTGSRRPDPS